VIYWGDETGISNQDQIGPLLRAQGPDPGGRADRQADHPEHDLGGEQPRADALHALRGCLERRRLHRLPAAADQGRRQKVVLIVDNLKVHKAGKVQAWVESHAHEIELFYLPSYAPDHNPSEYLNNDLKQQLRQQPQPGSKDELIERTRSCCGSSSARRSAFGLTSGPSASAMPRNSSGIMAGD
jgi:hypothetical protein